MRSANERRRKIASLQSLCLHRNRFGSLSPLWVEAPPLLIEGRVGGENCAHDRRWRSVVTHTPNAAARPVILAIDASVAFVKRSEPSSSDHHDHSVGPRDRCFNCFDEIAPWSKGFHIKEHLVPAKVSGEPIVDAPCVGGSVVAAVAKLDSDRLRRRLPSRSCHNYRPPGRGR